ncbi:hypothetical protein [Planktothrix agardhii]|jgi:hypothetical protein|uniref:Uncharacterized protein n=1 Tax=Planktothrix agardhii TaxID=1160 RepID=A0AAD1Q6X2_PLAAG|nr:hypothetical protein [Planktothrix agardhii]CAD5983457.1 hypothetical protein PANO66_04367 [Planktothrix agardhii]
MCNDNNVDKAEIERILREAHNDDKHSLLTGVPGNYHEIVNTANKIITVLVLRRVVPLSVEEVRNLNITNDNNELLTHNELFIYLEALADLNVIIRNNNCYQCQPY